MKKAEALALALGLAFATACAAVRLADPPPLRMGRELLFDTYQRIRPRAYTPQPVRIVDIDEASLRSLGQWPWPRTQLARLTDRLAALGAAAIAFDMVFPEPDRMSPSAVVQAPDLAAALGPDAAATLGRKLPDTDRIFAAAMAGHPVALGFAARLARDGAQPTARAGMAYTGVDPLPVLPPFASAVVNVPVLEASAAGLGAISIAPQDDEGILRHLALVWSDGHAMHPGLALEALRLAQGESTILVRATPEPPPAVSAIRVGELEWPTTRTGEMRIYYTHDVRERYVSAARILAGDDAALRPLIEGHIVFVGTSAAGLLDMRVTPLRETVPGVSIHAQAVEQILSGEHLTRPDWIDAAETLLAFLLAVAVAAVTALAGPLAAFLFGGFLAAAMIGGSWLAFQQAGLLFDPLFAVVTGLLLHFLLTSFRFLVTDRDKRFVRRAFGRYVSASLLAQLERNPAALKLGGEEREMTILFLDIRGFTSISHALPPTRIVEFLNRILGRLSEDIVAEEGAIDKYIGDSIMAFWNAPVPVRDHPRRACRAALRMRHSLARMNADDAFGLGEAGLADSRVRIGIGMNLGRACVGNVGSQERFNYSAVGDAVNVASRIEGLSKTFGFDILADASMAEAARDLAWLEGGEVRLRGRAVASAVFLLVGDEVVAASEPFAALAEVHGDLMRATRAGDLAGFSSALDDCMRMAEASFPGLVDFYQLARTRLAPVARETVVVEPVARLRSGAGPAG